MANTDGLKRFIPWVLAMIVGVIVVVAFFLSRANRQNGSSTNSSNTNATVTNSTSTTQAEIASTILAASIKGNTVTYYDLNLAAFLSLNLDTQAGQILLRLPLSPESQIAFSPDGAKALVQVDSTSPWQLYSLAPTATPTNLNSGVTVPTWNALGSRIMYEFIDSTGNGTVTDADADGTNWTSLVANSNYEQLWWSPLETYAIGRRVTNGETWYDRILVSSKDAKPLVKAYGALRWSPSGKQALLDSTDGASLTIAAVDTGDMKSVAVAGKVNQFVWQDDTHLVGVSNNQVVSIDLTSNKQQPLGDASQVDALAETLGLYKNQLIYTQNGSVFTLPLGTKQ